MDKKCPARRCRYENCVDFEICNKKEALLNWFAAVSNAKLMSSSRKLIIDGNLFLKHY